MINKVMVIALKMLIYAYRYTFSALIGNRCRFQPTCSVYALEALEYHGPWRGILLTCRRLMRCHPFGRTKSWTFDPVPPPCGPTAPTASRSASIQKQTSESSRYE
ncbi:MAG: membrane protein insertion efficiency factor YidD [Alphaproteobacteria bacterium]|nr:membrane protein insertion efficiency factor YidD [Alphaproteobacteria bacterium]